MESSPRLGRHLALQAAVALAYFGAATLGFRLAFVAEQVTTVWAPTGIALAAVIWGGTRVWPAIWLGALLANIGTSAPAWTAVVIASGNTLEAVTAGWWLRRGGRLSVSFDRVSDVFAFVLVAAVACTAISATVGVTTLCAAAVQPWARFPTLWFDWWFGDALGAIVVAPVLLTTLPRSRSRIGVVRIAVWTAAAAALAHVIFGQVFGSHAHPVEYLAFPLAIAAAATAGPAVTSWVVLSGLVVSIWHTVNGAGPFASGDVRYSLILLQSFMAVLAGTSLLLAAAVAERLTTQQREQEAAASVRYRQELLTLAQHAGGIATFVWDFRNQVAQCSPEFFTIFGLPAVEGVMTGADWGRFVHPDDRDRMGAHLAAALQGSEPATADYRIVRPDGGVRWLTYAGQVQRTPDGDRMLGTVLDITDRKRLEAELRHHAAEVERILETIGEGFVSFDRQFRYVYVNAPAARMLGRSPEELIGQTPWDVFPAEATRESQRILEAAAVSGVPTQYEIHVPSWNRWFENRVYPSESGLSIFFADVTGRIQADAALRENRDVLTLAMRSGSMGAWARNLETNEVWWSRELEERFGLDPGGFNRTEAGFFEFVHDDDREAVRSAVDDAVRTRGDYIVEFRFRHGNGDWRWMEGRGRAVYADDGTPRTLYGIGIDVTERKRAELALREAKLAAESANRLKDQFLATLSHELRTPLNAILGYGRMLQTDTIAAEKRGRAVDVIVRNAVLQNQLVEDLLDMSRITTGKVRLDPAPVLVVSIVREAVEGIKPAADAKGIALETDLDPFSGSVSGDSTRLQQVFWNLLTNAVKFTKAGGRVAVSVRREGQQVSVTVNDTGAGISPAFLPFVFEAFHQGESRFDRAHGGLGLGLAIAKQLVELHGGTIRASSAGVGQGATFEIKLPCVARPTSEALSAAEAPVHGAAPSAGSLVKVKILLVDDEKDTLTMYLDALEDAGADVRAVSTSQAALEILNEWQPNLLVTDLGLPGMDGYQLLAAIRAKYSPTVLPAVAVSAYARLDDRSRALAAGFQAHVAKPVDPAGLIATLQGAMCSVN